MLELENMSMSIRLDTISDKLCFYVRAEATPRWVVLFSSVKKHLTLILRVAEQIWNLSVLILSQIVVCTLRHIVHHPWNNQLQRFQPMCQLLFLAL